MPHLLTANHQWTGDVSLDARHLVDSGFGQKQFADWVEPDFQWDGLVGLVVENFSASVVLFRDGLRCPLLSSF